MLITTVVLDYPPQIDEAVFEPEVKGGEGDFATLRCAVQGNPTPTISWKKGNLVVSTYRKYFLNTKCSPK